jgi:hypothetical protein
MRLSREKQLKKWRRDWKIRMLEEQNPDWRDAGSIPTRLRCYLIPHHLPIGHAEAGYGRSQSMRNAKAQVRDSLLEEERFEPSVPCKRNDQFQDASFWKTQSAV